MTTITVLDKGYVRLVDVRGSELDIVNAARLSYNNESKELDEKDKSLIRFLVKNKHTSPLRHVGLSIEFYAPIAVARQHWRHAVGASTVEDGTPWSELSRRYVRGQEEFYIPAPDMWRAAPANSKQGSGENFDADFGQEWTEKLETVIDMSLSLYDDAVDAGIAPEQARLFLPAYSMYTKYLWSPSVHSLLNFIELRSDEHSQYEIRVYSQAVEKMIEENFPTVLEAFRSTTV